MGMYQKMKKMAIKQESIPAKKVKIIPRGEVEALNLSMQWIRIQNEREYKEALEMIYRDNSLYKEEVTRTLKRGNK